MRKAYPFRGMCPSTRSKHRSRSRLETKPSPPCCLCHCSFPSLLVHPLHSPTHPLTHPSIHPPTARYSKITRVCVRVREIFANVGSWQK